MQMRDGHVSHAHAAGALAPALHVSAHLNFRVTFSSTRAVLSKRAFARREKALNPIIAEAEVWVSALCRGPPESDASVTIYSFLVVKMRCYVFMSRRTVKQNNAFHHVLGILFRFPPPNTET